MAEVIIFDRKHYDKTPEDYPMVGRFMGPLARLTIMFTDHHVDDGCLIIKRDNGSYFTIPKDVASAILRTPIIDGKRPWLHG